MRIKQGLDLNSDVERLWWNVLKQIIKDYGVWVVSKYTSSAIIERKIVRFSIPPHNTDNYLKADNPDLLYICDAIGTDPEYVLNIIHEYIPPIGRSYYDNIRMELGL